MGIHDRDYYRDDSPSGLHFRSGRMMVTNLVIINIALYVLDVLTSRDHWLTKHMMASPESLRHPWLWWQLVTYGFAHSPENIGHIFWNMFALWIFGRDVEGVYGPKEFLRIYLATVVLGGVIWAARGCLMFEPQTWERYKVLGASGAVTAVTLLFCIHFPKRIILLMFVLPVPAWFVGALIIVGNVLGLMNPHERVAFDVHLIGAAFAICYYKFGWNLGRWTPSLSAAGKWLKRRPKLKVHRPDDVRREEDDLADEVLAKVASDGIESLSARERRILEEYSRRMRQKHR